MEPKSKVQNFRRPSMGGNRGWWDHRGAKHHDGEGMWVDAAAQGASGERRKVGGHGDVGMQRRNERALAVENEQVV